ncbi:hypothetical protein QBC35DRAFT_487939 [Podospora australis]|uniref:Uncharacterized protein n=1 Tax=Podospora australis TaxID=1536484 RepID=A0AAN6WZR9_9PEZI|nr:hypothetical protein QBC35DRAFT_487939 [Podospora australis]
MAILHRNSVRLFVLGWLGWLVIAAVLVASTASIKFTPKILTATSVFWVASVLGYLILSLYRICRSPNTSVNPPRYRLQCDQNLGNTIITLLVATLALPVLYWTTWFPDQTRNVSTFERDTVDKVYFPSLTLFQRSDWTSQANLDVSARPKCFLGWHNEKAPSCDNITIPGVACQCTDQWDDDVRDFEWQNTSYRALSLISSKSMVSPIPTYQMIAQAFFTFNSSQARADSSHVLSPSLWIAIHDPTLTVQQTLESGHTRMVLINANGMTAINLGINRRKALGRAPADDYQLSISTIPSMDLQCDVSADGGARGMCFVSLFLQFPSFERLVSRQDVAMKWEDVASAAGSWFALFQLAGWIFSGLAWHEGS